MVTPPPTAADGRTLRYRVPPRPSAASCHGFCVPEGARTSSGGRPCAPRRFPRLGGPAPRCLGIGTPSLARSDRLPSCRHGGCPLGCCETSSTPSRRRSAISVAPLINKARKVVLQRGGLTPTGTPPTIPRCDTAMLRSSTSRLVWKVAVQFTGSCPCDCIGRRASPAVWGAYVYMVPEALPMSRPKLGLGLGIDSGLDPVQLYPV